MKEDSTPMDTPQSVIQRISEHVDAIYAIATEHDVTVIFAAAAYDLIDRQEIRKFTYSGRETSVRGLMSMLDEKIAAEVSDEIGVYYDCSIDDEDDDGDVPSTTPR